MQAVEVLTPRGQVVDAQSCAAYDDGTAYTPQMPATITGFTVQANHELVAYFTAPGRAVRRSDPSGCRATKLE